MGKKKKVAKKPVTLLGGPKAVVGKKHARKVTSEFHRLTVEIAKTENAQDRAELEQKLEQLGGRRAYQEASILATQSFSTSRWVVGNLQKRGYKGRLSQDSPRLLEVGAINTQLLSCKWLDVRAIDLESTHPRIEKKDFFSFAGDLAKFDIIICSMVVNCVPASEERGRMILLLRQLLGTKGLLYLMLPTSCLTHSENISVTDFEESLLPAIGFAIEERRNTPKVSFWVCSTTVPGKEYYDEFKTRRKVAQSSRKSRNLNFDITLPATMYQEHFSVLAGKRHAHPEENPVDACPT
mmetsp:Transcript_34532/g.97399  ORF Transcript_34532/g.97399 Transcript_34532/m.97399 type:complete len:295 (-) Transcript_34532:76-960(-)